MMNSDRFPDLLDLPLLTDLTPEDRAKFLDGCVLRQFDKRTTVLHQGEMTDSICIVAEGGVEVAYMSEEGYHSVIYVARAGELLGLVEAIAQRPLAASCTAFSNTTVFLCKKKRLTSRLSTKRLLRGLAETTHNLLERDNKTKTVHQFYSSEQRICSFLFDLSEQETELLISQSYLANVAGSSRQTVNRELGHLRDLGVIELGKGRITILDRPALIDRIDRLGDNT